MAFALSPVATNLSLFMIVFVKPREMKLLCHAAALAFMGWYLFSPSFALAGDSATLAAQHEAAEVSVLVYAEIRDLPGVCGVQSYTDPEGVVAIQINVSKVTPEIIKAIPPVLEGFPVVFRVESGLTC